MTTGEISAALISGAACAGIALFFRLPAKPDGNSLLSLAGSLVGAAIAVAASLVVLSKQFETTDQRHLRTIRNLLTRMKIQGRRMASPHGALDPARYSKEAGAAFRIATAIASEIRSSGPNIAIVSHELESDDFVKHIARFEAANGGISAPDLKARGEELAKLSDDCLQRLTRGL